MVGRIINGRYKIINLIAEGGMAYVYLAEDMEKDHKVALKILKNQFSGDQNFIRRFMQEAMAVATLNHPNIVKIYDYGNEDNIYYLSLEYIDGSSLKELIDEKGFFSVGETEKIISQVSDALEHAHSKNIIHRDIKPHNIMVDSKGLVKVTDFGIAKAVSSATITHAGGMLGSVQYFSPEQAKGEKTTVKSDIYSLAVVVYEMLTGELPFYGDTHVGIAMKHIQERPRSIRDINPKVPKQLELVIMKALGKKQEFRYESVSEFKRDFVDFKKAKNLNERAIEENIQSRNLENTIISNEEIEPKGRKKLFLIPIFLILAVFMGASYFFSSSDVRVPALVGLEASKAQRELAKSDLKMNISKNVFSDKYEKGIVVSQDPKENFSIKKGRTVDVVVSNGVRQVIVPDIVGANIEKTRINVVNLNLEIGNEEKIYSDDFEKGEIIYQEPKRGTEVPEGTKIDVVVSMGVKPIEFEAPELTGITRESAIEIIQKLNLEIGNISYEDSFDFNENVVSKQTPTPKTLIKENTAIDLVISKGPGPRIFSKNISINVKKKGELKIIVNDISGERIVFQENVTKGQINKSVEYYSEGEISAFLNDKKIFGIQVP